VDAGVLLIGGFGVSSHFSDGTPASREGSGFWLIATCHLASSR
jgi:hypothetical protein